MPPAKLGRVVERPKQIFDGAALRRGEAQRRAVGAQRDAGAHVGERTGAEAHHARRCTAGGLAPHARVRIVGVDYRHTPRRQSTDRVGVLATNMDALTIPAAGGDPKQLTDLPVDVGGYKLSPDGKRVALALEAFVDCKSDLGCTKKRLDDTAARKSSGVLYDKIFVRHWDTWAVKIKESEETTHFSVVDREGNAVSITTTLNDSYGSRTVVAGAGFILNNEMDDFSAKPGTANLYGAVGGKANAIAPQKRPLSSMTPTIVTKGGKNWMVLGTPGGTTIPTSVFQVIVNVAEFGQSLPEAVQAKRFHHQWKPNQISAEEGCFSEEVQAKLERLGHRINYRESIGRMEAIIRLPNGKWQGVADGRGDDAAAGY